MQGQPYSTTDSLPYLRPGTVLDDYVIERSLGGGGFSLVYLAQRRYGGQQVAIKEYFPRKLASRQAGNQILPLDDECARSFIRGRIHFLEEAKALTRLKHPNILEVLSFFQGNGTAYIVMAFSIGRALSDYLIERRGRLSELFVLHLFYGLLDGVEAIHNAGFLHLDIKPQNILIRPGGSPVLLDFGAVQPNPPPSDWKAGQVLTKGFSPPEQYSSRHGDIGPWSDLYALGATMRSCLDGRAPPPSNGRAIHDHLVPTAQAHRNRYDCALLEAIDWAMAVTPDNRPQSADALRKALPLLAAT